MTIDNIIDAISDLITPVMPGVTCIRGQVNRVPFPTGPCAVLTEMHGYGLGTPIATSADLTLTLGRPTQIDVQIDIYGPSSGDWAMWVAMLFRTAYACDQLPEGLVPLFASDPIQAPLIDAEKQYESRWTVTASLEYNPTITFPQQSATALSVAKLEPLL